MPKTKKALRGGLRACKNLLQPPPYIFGFWGLRKIVACSQSSSQCLLVSTVFGTVSSLHPTSFLMIFTLVYILAEDIEEAGGVATPKSVRRRSNKSSSPAERQELGLN